MGIRVLVNGVATLGTLTGIGHYVRQLVLQLAAEPQLDALGVFTGQRVIAAHEFCGFHAPANARRYDQLKRIVQLVPYRRQLVAGVREAFFRRVEKQSAWSLYHEPNYISHRFAGPLVTTVCDLCFLRYPQFQPKDRMRWLRDQLTPTLERSASIITISEFTRRELLMHCPWLEPARIYVTPLGVDQRQFQPVADATTDAAAVRQRLGLPASFVLYLGTLEPRKNLQGLAQAYRLLPKAVRREFPLVLAGTTGWNDWYFRPMLAALEQEGAVRVIGYVQQSDLAPLMRAATVFCFPSLYEGFGLPPLEAAACGTPVVCSRTASLPEVMGDAAVYVDPTAPEDIATALIRVLEDAPLRTRLAAAGPARAAQFTWSRCAHETLVAYRRALDCGSNEPVTTLPSPIRRAS